MQPGPTQPVPAKKFPLWGPVMPVADDSTAHLLWVSVVQPAKLPVSKPELETIFAPYAAQAPNSPATQIRIVLLTLPPKTNSATVRPPTRSNGGVLQRYQAQ